MRREGREMAQRQKGEQETLSIIGALLSTRMSTLGCAIQFRSAVAPQSRAQSKGQRDDWG